MGMTQVDTHSYMGLLRYRRHLKEDAHTPALIPTGCSFLEVAG